MNKLFFLALFIVVSGIHYAIFSYTLDEEKKLEQIKHNYSKVTIKLSQASMQEPKKVQKKAEEIKKPKPKKEPKAIKKEIKKEVVEKVKPKLLPKKVIAKKKEAPIKKEEKRVKKTEPKKEIIKKVVEKEVVKKELKKIEKPKEEVKIAQKKINKPQKTEDKTSNQQAIKYLKKFEEFRKSYKSRLIEAIDKNKRYPRASKRLGEEGDVLVSFTVLKNGTFKDIEILTSSNKRRLDKAARKAVELTKAFEPFSKDIKEKFLKIKLRMRFELDR